MRLDPQKTALDLGYLGKQSQISVYWNLSTPQLIEQAIMNQEGNLSPTGALLVNTGEFTGRSPNDKYIVNYQDKSDQEIDWGKVNQPLLPEKFEGLLDKVLSHLENKNIYVQEVLVGSHPQHQRRIRIITEFAWSALFARDLLIPGTDMYTDGPDFTIIQAPGFCADPQVDGTKSKTFIILDFVRRIVLIGNTQYAGEIKKAVFTIMNRLLPGENVLPMHCSANIGMQGDTSLFFGLSGTGKTTLSSDPDRFLIGDDEHGWAMDGIFNFEGGCYAKTINLKKELEPIIWDAAQSFGSVLENVTFDSDTRLLDFTDSSVTENTRAAYSLKNVARKVKSGMGGHPDHIFFLCADAFGVLPPIASLTPNQAAYFFLSGYTAKLAGTERGLGCEPQATFSACFGAPFMPLNPVRYADMLREKISEHHAKVWLVNTGWTGGPYGVGSRTKLPYTRAMISAAIKGILDEAPSEVETFFGLKIPNIIPGVPSKMLNPSKSWDNPEQYKLTATALIGKFRENIAQYKGKIDGELLTLL
ncbi:phosphoenolpyruvate carboxykinase (ATP) [bacterium]|nr:phosphoenolpyruvate carboxykinase (ATP) [bacterium]